jgi:hypothetical protein
MLQTKITKMDEFQYEQASVHRIKDEITEKGGKLKQGPNMISSSEASIRSQKK